MISRSRKIILFLTITTFLLSFPPFVVTQDAQDGEDEKPPVVKPSEDKATDKEKGEDKDKEKSSIEPKPSETSSKAEDKPLLEYTITAMNGKVSYQRYDSKSKKWRRAKLGKKFKGRYRFSTGMNSSVTLTFANGIELFIGSTSQLTITKFLIPTTDPTKRETNVDVKYGRVRVKITKEVTRTDMRVSTPCCTTGVVGTIFSVSHDPSENESTIEIFEGVVKVEHNETGESVEIEGDGQGNGERCSCDEKGLTVTDIHITEADMFLETAPEVEKEEEEEKDSGSKFKIIIRPGFPRGEPGD